MTINITPYPKEFLQSLHKTSFANLVRVAASQVCVCFFCQKMFPSTDVREKIDEKNEAPTVCCPHCHIDAVLSQVDLIAFGVDQKDWAELVRQMHMYFFNYKLQKD